MNTDNGALNFTADIKDEKLIGSIDEMERRIKGLSDTTVKEGQKLDQFVDVTAENVQIQKKVIADLEKQLKTIEKQIEKMPPGLAQQEVIKEAKQLKAELDAEKTALQGLEQEVKKNEKSQVSFRTQLRNAREELIRMEQAGLRGTAAYAEMQQRLGELQDAYDDASAQARVLANDEKVFQGIVSTVSGLTGAFSAAQGAVGLFAGENENLQKIMLRVQSLMGITIGLQQVAETLNKDSYFSIVVLTKAKEYLAIAETKVATAMGVTTAAARVLIGTLTLGLSVAITAVTIALSKYISQQKEAKKRQEDFNKAVVDGSFEAITAIKTLVTEWAILAGTMQEKEAFVKNNKKRFEDLGIEVNNVAEAEALLSNPDNVNKFITAQVLKAKALAATQLAAEKYKEALLLQADIEAQPDQVTSYVSQGQFGQMLTATVPNAKKAQMQADLKVIEEQAEALLTQSANFTKDAEAVLSGFQFRRLASEDDTNDKLKEKMSEFAQMREDLMRKTKDTEIALERSRIQDKKELIDFDLQQVLKAIDEEQKAYEQKAKEAGEKSVDLSYFDRLRRAVREQAGVEKDLIDEEALKKEFEELTKKQQETLKEQQQNLKQLLSEYQTSRQRMLTLEKEYNDDILALNKALNEAKTEQERDQIRDSIEARKQAFEEDKSGMNLSDLMSSDDWNTLFSDLESLSVEKMIQLKNQLEAEWSKLDLSPDQLKALRDQMDKVTEQIKKKNPFKALSEAVKAYKKDQSALNLSSLTGAINASADYMNENLQKIFNSMENLGAKGMDEASAIATDVVGMVGDATNLAMGIATGNPLQIIEASIGLITKGIDLIAGVKDRKLERSIQKHREEVEKLQLAYEDLERAVDKALGSDRYQSQKQQIDNLKKQRQEYAQMAKAEADKKKTDDDKVKEYQDRMRQNAQEIIEIVNGIREEILGSTVSSVANDLGNAMIEAFAAGEDAAIAWGKKVDDIVGNVIRRMLIQKLVEEPVGKIINQYMSKWVDSNGNFLGFDMVMASAQAMGEDLSALGTGLSSALEQLPDEIRKYFTGGDADKAKGSLSGAIQGASEESISMLSGYINAIRINQIQGNEILRSQLMTLNQISANTSYNVLLVEILSVVRSMANSDPLRPQGL